VSRRIDLDALYQAHHDPLLRFFARRTADGEIALDLWAETFAQAVRSHRRFRGRSADDQAAWLYTIAHRQLASYYRRGVAERRALERLKIERPPADPALIADVEHRAGLEALRGEIVVALGTLAEDTRRAVQLRVVDELPYDQIADVLTITETAARARVSRGLKALRDVLDPQLMHEVTAR
jgi:RNA polymerase sigma factor (sigma-70 family)